MGCGAVVWAVSGISALDVSAVVYGRRGRVTKADVRHWVGGVMQADTCPLWHSKSDGPCRKNERLDVSNTRAMVRAKIQCVSRCPSIRDFKGGANHDVEIIRFN